jgi:hypothetical protein
VLVVFADKALEIGHSMVHTLVYDTKDRYSTVKHLVVPFLRLDNVSNRGAAAGLYDG